MNLKRRHKSFMNKPKMGINAPGQVSFQSDGIMDGLADGFRDGLADGFRDGLLDGLLDGLVDGLLDGLLDGLRDGLADGLLDGSGDSAAPATGQATLALSPVPRQQHTRAAIKGVAEQADDPPLTFPHDIPTKLENT
jgi:hypothetical protein